MTPEFTGQKPAHEESESTVVFGRNNLLGAETEGEEEKIKPFVANPRKREFDPKTYTTLFSEMHAKPCPAIEPATPELSHNTTPKQARERYLGSIGLSTIFANRLISMLRPVVGEFFKWGEVYLENARQQRPR